jgi:hypothetical protein
MGSFSRFFSGAATSLRTKRSNPSIPGRKSGSLRRKGSSLARLKAIKKALVDPTMSTRRSRTVKSSGDRLLVEFASALDALRCAVEVQRGLAAQNSTVPPDQKIEFRIGIHVGDIIFDETTFSATASISPCGCRALPSPAASACRYPRHAVCQRSHPDFLQKLEV